MTAFRIAATVLVLALLVPASSQAHEGDGARARNTVTINPAALINGRLRFEVEHSPATHLSVFGGFHLWTNEALFAKPGGRIDGTGIGFGFRHFPWGDAPAGVFVGPTMSLSALTTRDQKETGFGWSAGVMAGYTFLFDYSLVASAGLGLSYFEMTLQDKNGDTVGLLGVTPRLRVALGVSF